MSWRPHRVAYPVVLAAGIVIGSLARPATPHVVFDGNRRMPSTAAPADAPTAEPERSPPAEVLREEVPSRQPGTVPAEHVVAPAASDQAVPPCERCRARDQAADAKLAAEIAGDENVERVKDPVLRERIAAKLRESHDEWARLLRNLRDELDRECDRKVQNGDYRDAAESRRPDWRTRKAVAMRSRNLADGTKIVIELLEGESFEYERLCAEMNLLSEQRRAAVLELLTEARESGR